MFYLLFFRNKMNLIQNIQNYLDAYPNIELMTHDFLEFVKKEGKKELVKVPAKKQELNSFIEEGEQVRYYQQQLDQLEELSAKLEQFLSSVDQKLKEPEPKLYCISCGKDLPLHYFEVIDLTKSLYEEVCDECKFENDPYQNLTLNEPINKNKYHGCFYEDGTCNSNPTKCSLCGEKFCNKHSSHTHEKYTFNCTWSGCSNTCQNRKSYLCDMHERMIYLMTKRK